MMKTYDESVEINYIPNWPYISNHLYRILIIGSLGSGKANMLLKLISATSCRQNFYVKDLSKYQLLINGRKKVKINMKKSKDIY